MEEYCVFLRFFHLAKFNPLALTGSLTAFLSLKATLKTEHWKQNSFKGIGSLWYYFIPL